MIPIDLLRAAGTVELLFNLTHSDGVTVAEAADQAGVSESTARKRLKAMEEAGLAESGAAIRGGQPVKVRVLTSHGEETAAALEDIVGEHGDDPEDNADA